MEHRKIVSTSHFDINEVHVTVLEWIALEPVECVNTGW